MIPYTYVCTVLAGSPALSNLQSGRLRSSERLLHFKMAVKTRDEPPADWNKPCCEKHLAEIALRIPEWREVSPFLGLTKADECEILGSAPHSVRLQKIEMLKMWKEKRGGKATYKRLCRVFTKCDMLDLEEKVQNLLAAKSSSSSDEEGELQLVY